MDVFHESLKLSTDLDVDMILEVSENDIIKKTLVFANIKLLLNKYFIGGNCYIYE